MKRLSALVILLALVAFSSTAIAGEEEETQFVEFDHLVIDGEFVEPDGSVFTHAGEPEFDRLLRLDPSFVDQTTEDVGQLDFR